MSSDVTKVEQAAVQTTTQQNEKSAFRKFIESLTDREQYILMICGLVTFLLCAFTFSIAHAIGESKGRPEKLIRVITRDADGNEHVHALEGSLK